MLELATWPLRPATATRGARLTASSEGRGDGEGPGLGRGEGSAELGAEAPSAPTETGVNVLRAALDLDLVFAFVTGTDGGSTDTRSRQGCKLADPKHGTGGATACRNNVTWLSNE